MRYYIDTEFDESSARLISLGVVCEDDTEFYAVNSDWWDLINTSKSKFWLIKNVAQNLFHPIPTEGIVLRQEDGIAELLREFLSKDDDVRFFGYKCAWDIVLIHRLFGGYQGVLDSKANVPLVCFDVNHIALSNEVTRLKELVPPFSPEHHALVDARWTKHVHNQLILQYGKEL